MHGRQSDHHEQEPGEAGQLEAEVASSDDGGVGRDRPGICSRCRATLQATLGRTQAQRAEAAKVRRALRRGGRRGRR